MVVAGALVLGFAAWAFVFRLPFAGMWPRTWLAALALSAYAIATAAAGHRLDELLGPVDVTTIGIGLLGGVGWLVTTHVGHDTIQRLWPALFAKVGDLYSLRARGQAAQMVGPVTAMGVGEELLFRGTVQGRAGFVAAVAVYTAVQLVTGNRALVLAAVLCGGVWGGLTWWTGGLVAPLIAHVIWTDGLAFVWPLRAPRRDRSVGVPDAAPVTDAIG